MQQPVILFFGSTADSVTVAQTLTDAGYPPSAVITQPAKPKGRKGTVSPTPVAQWATSAGITCLTFPSDPQKSWLFDDEAAVTDSLTSYAPDLLISSSYGMMIPLPVIKKSRHGGLNLHPSLLPRWRGADPVPWAILAGDRETGITVVTLTERFDAGKIILQRPRQILDTDRPDPLRSALFRTGAGILTSLLPSYLAGEQQGTPMPDIRTEPYAYRFSRDDGYIPWPILLSCFSGTPPDSDTVSDMPFMKKLKEKDLLSEVRHPGSVSFIGRMIRAFSPWPGVWTKVPVRGMEKRLKLLTADVSGNALTLKTVQLEGKQPVPFSQFRDAYL